MSIQSAVDVALRVKSTPTKQQGLEAMCSGNHLSFGVRPPGFKFTGDDLGQPNESSLASVSPYIKCG